MNLIPQLLTQIAGGAGAVALDRAKPEWTLHVGGTKTGFGADGTPDGVSVGPGALAALAVIVGLGVMPGKATASTAKAIAANLAGGALVAEGVKLASEKVLPMLDGSAAATSVPPMPGATHGMPFGHNAPQMGYAWRHPNAYTNYEIQSALAQYQRAAA